MRARELFENQNTYLDMINPYLAKLQGPARTVLSSRWKELVKKTKREFGRQDRVIWALRWRRLGFAQDTDNPSKLSMTAEQRLEVLNRFAYDLGFSDYYAAQSEYQKWFPYGADRDFIHFASHPAPEIQAVRWEKQSPTEFQGKLKAIEAEWQKKSEQEIDHTNSQQEEVLKIDHEWSWYKLDRSECSVEAQAMGHCGNADGNPDDRILSLRRRVRGDLYRPSLTFIINNGYLGEMKGRENKKPVEKYHPAIVALLMQPWVKGIVGGGFDAKNNFSITDLPEEQARALVKMKPDLISIEEIVIAYKHSPNDRLILDFTIKALKDFFGEDAVDSEERWIIHEKRSVADHIAQLMVYGDQVKSPTRLMEQFWNKFDLPRGELYHTYLSTTVPLDFQYDALDKVDVNFDGKEVIVYTPFYQIPELFYRDSWDGELWIDTFFNMYGDLSSGDAMTSVSDYLYTLQHVGYNASVSFFDEFISAIFMEKDQQIFADKIKKQNG